MPSSWTDPNQKSIGHLDNTSRSLRRSDTDHQNCRPLPLKLGFHRLNRFAKYHRRLADSCSIPLLHASFENNGVLIRLPDVCSKSLAREHMPTEADLHKDSSNTSTASHHFYHGIATLACQVWKLLLSEADDGPDTGWLRSP